MMPERAPQLHSRCKWFFDRASAVPVPVPVSVPGPAHLSLKLIDVVVGLMGPELLLQLELDLEPQSQLVRQLAIWCTCCRQFCAWILD